MNTQDSPINNLKNKNKNSIKDEVILLPREDNRILGCSISKLLQNRISEDIRLHNKKDNKNIDEIVIIIIIEYHQIHILELSVCTRDCHELGKSGRDN